MIHRLIREQVVFGAATDIWSFFATPANLDLITPASLSFHIQGDGAPSMYAGQMIEYRIGLMPGVTTRWLTEITHVREGEYFVDEQRIGPYRLWHHEHRFAPISSRRGVKMTDRITYEVGWGPVGEAFHALWIRSQLASIFDYRARKVAELFPGLDSHVTTTTPGTAAFIMNEENNTHAHILNVYDHEKVITLDELPDLRAKSAAVFRSGPHYTGSAIDLPPGDYTQQSLATLGVQDGVLGSLQLAAGLRAVLYSGDHFTGKAKNYAQSTADLTKKNLDGPVRSIRILLKD